MLPAEAKEKLVAKVKLSPRKIDYDLNKSSVSWSSSIFTDQDKDL